MSLFREDKFFQRKMPTVPALEISLNFNIFSKCTKFHQTCRIYWNHHQKHACKIWAHSEKLTYFIENANSASPWNIMKFQLFSKVHQISSNLQNIFESSSETCMWNLSLFREVDLFHRKMPTVPALEISLNFNLFPKFTKFHQTCRTYLNHHQKHACEIWAFSEKLNFNSKKNADSVNPWNIMKFQHFLQISPTFIKLAGFIGFSSETCMWNLSLFREDNFFHRKMLIVSTLEKSWNFNIFQSSSISSNLQNIFESSSETCMWIWANSNKLTYFIEKCRQCQPFEISWNFNIISKFIIFHQTCRTYWNHHQKHACEIWAFSEKLIFSKKNANSAGPRNIVKFQHFFQSAQNFS